MTRKRMTTRQRPFGQGALLLALVLGPVALAGCSGGSEPVLETAVALQAVEEANCGLNIATEVHGVSRRGFHARIRVTDLDDSDQPDCDARGHGQDKSSKKDSDGRGHEPECPSHDGHHADKGRKTPLAFTVLVDAGDAELVHVAHGSFKKVEGGYLLSTENARREELHGTHGSHNTYTFDLKFKGKYSELTANIISSHGVNCDQTPPTIALTTSGDFFTSDGTLTLNAEAADNVAVAKVVLSQDGEPLATDTTAPYTFEIPVTNALNGRHRYEATAYDLTGNTASETERVLVAIGNKFFGTAVSNAADYSALRTYFNQLTPGNAGKWGSVEATRGVMNWTELDTAYAFAKDNGIPFKLHTLVWGQQQPNWLADLPVDEQLAEIEEWFAALAERYPDIDMIDVVNEPLHAPPSYAEALGGAGATGWDWLIASFEMARSHFPDSELILNEYSVLKNGTNTANFVDIVNLLEERGLIDGIGEQGHFYERTPELPVLAANLAVLAATGLPIYISELDVNIADDACHAVKMSERFPIFWESPSVVGVTHWGYRQGSVWRPDSWLLGADGTPRAALNWLECYIHGGTSCPLAPCMPPLHEGDARAIVIEAEEFDSAHALDAAGSVVAYVDDGSWLSFDRVSFNSNWDTLSVTFGRNATTPASLSFHLGSLDNPPVATFPLTNTGGWMTMTTAAIPWAATSGEQKLFLRFNGGGANVDKITFTGPALPFQMNNGEVVIEAEDFHAQVSNGSSDVWTVISNPLASGGKRVDLGPDDNSVWTANIETTSPRLDYRVNFTSTGTFTFWVRGAGATANPWGGDTVWGGLDGVVTTNTPIDYSGSTDLIWSNGRWGTVAKITVNTLGVHTVSLWGREDGFEADKIIVTNSSRVPTGDGTVTNEPFLMSGGEVLIEAEEFNNQMSNGSSDIWTVISNSQASAGKSIDLRPDDSSAWTANVTTTAPRVDYKVNFTSTGTFNFWVRGTGENGGNDSCWAGVDNTLANIHLSSSADSNLGWTNGTFGTAAKVTINTLGVHTVSLWGREDGFEADRILITNSNRVPTGDGSQVLNTGDGTTRWVGTWGSGQQLTETSNLPPTPGLANNTLRQFVYVSIGGASLRLRFSNLFGNNAVVMNSVHVALPTTGSGINTATDRALTFFGSPSVVLGAGKEIWSDAFDFNLAAQSRLAVTINFGSVPRNVTGHPGSRTTSYLQSGNVVSNATMSGASTDHWYFITALDVAAAAPASTLVTLGDSIMDGRGSTTNGNDRWPDVLSRALRLNGPTSQVAVVNQGIGGNGVFGGLGPSATQRFARDVLAVSSVKWVILNEGVNDIGGAASTQIADQLISAYQSFITQAHASNLRIYGVPILPFGGSSYDSAIHETARQTVNTWIRTSGAFDAVIDLDTVVRDPATPTVLLPVYDSGDHLHPSVAGHQALGQGVPLTLFVP